MVNIRKPLSVHKIEGTARKYHKDCLIHPILETLPVPPKWIIPEAKDIFLSIVNYLNQTQLCHEGYIWNAVVMSNELAFYYSCAKKTKKMPKELTADFIRHRKLMDAALKNIIRLSTELGLTPVSGQKLSFKSTYDKRDDFDLIING